uniref:Dehydrin n=1 Tax=Tanacetum cinerariifolium TaxID=118510 RepID=A0A699HBE9_TANCI|nr:dehydrin [Tanacetum cinerariifolium]
MAQYGEQYIKQEGHETNEHPQNQLHSTAGHDIGGTGTNVHSTMSTGHDVGGMGTNVHSTTTGQYIGGTGANMGIGGGHGYVEGKQGVVEQIKEKLPGGDHGSDEHTTHATTTVGGGEYGNIGEEGHEKKGLMDKIKDKIPGVGNQ